MKNNYLNRKVGFMRWLFCLLFLTGLWTTNANAINIFSQNFETSWTTASTLSPAWTSVITGAGNGNNLWQRDDFTTGWTGVTSCPLPSAGANLTLHSARVHVWDAPTGTGGDLITPVIDFSAGAAAKQLSFYWTHTTGTALFNVFISLDGGTTYGASVFSGTTNAGWTLQTINLGSVTSSTVKIKFSMTNANFNCADIGLDEVSVIDLAPCVAPSAQPTSLVLTPSGSIIINGSFAAASGSDSYLIVRYASGATTTNPVDGITYNTGNALGSGTVVASTFGTTFSATGLAATTTYDFYVYSQNSACLGGPLYLGSLPLFSSATTNGASFASSLGGLWSSPATWSGGVVPAAGENVVIPSGTIVTVDQIVSLNTLSISGTLQWNATTNAMTISNNLTVTSTGNLLPYTTGGTGQTLNIGGNFQNDGYANCALASTVLNFNGSGSTLSGTGTFQGNGLGNTVPGIIRSLVFANLGANSISTTQNITVTSGFNHTAGSLNTNGKLTIDNTAQVYGQALNLRVASLAVTAMGSLYSVAPVVFGTAVTQWTNITGALGTRYVSGSNVYVCTVAANIGPGAPTHTSGVAQNLLWLGTIGTLGNPYQFNTTSVVGTQYFYGNNLYVATLANGIAANNAAGAPVHTSGIVNGYLYVGSPATATVNYDGTTQTARSLNLTSAGSGYSGAPAIVFSVGVAAGTGSGASASAVYIQNISGGASALTQKGGVATITGGITINSDQGTTALSGGNEQSSTGVGNVFTTGGGVNYTVAPLVAFGGPLALNLINNAGSAYAVAPTITVTGGTLIAGATAYTTSSFIINVNQGRVESVYLTSTTASYIVPPTLALTASPGVTATLAFPANCWPAATANIGSNRQITSFTMTNSGYGYAAVPLLSLGTSGTFTTAATTPTARIASYNLTLNFFAPAVSAVVSPDDAAIPASRKMTNLSLAGNGNGLNLSNNLTLFGTSPLTLTASLSVPGNILNLGGYNLLFTWNGYGGTTSTFNSPSNVYIKNGSMTLTGRGGGSTFNFPFAGNTSGGTFGWFAGSTPTIVTTGSTVTRVTVTETGAPSNILTGSGIAMGNRAYRVQFGMNGTGGFAVPSITGLNPTVTMNFNSVDGLTATQDKTFIADATALTGAWSLRSTAFGVSGALPAVGTKTTATVAPGPIAPTGNNFYAWAQEAPVITSFTPASGCAGSTSVVITGTGFNGATAVTIGGTPVTSFVVNSNTQITAITGAGSTGNVVVTANGFTATSAGTFTITPAPSAPLVTPAAATIALDGTATFTASGAGTFKWFTVAAGGTSIFTGPSFTTPNLCVTTTYYVGENDGSCDGARTAVVVTVTPVTIASSGSRCNNNTGSVTLVASGATSYSWSPVDSLNTTSGTTVIATPTATTTYTVTGVQGSCSVIATSTVTINAAPVIIAVTANPTLVCNNGSSALSVSLPPPTSYCAVTNAGGSVVTNVTLNTLNVSGLNALSPTYYHSNAPTGAATTTLTAGTSYTATLTLNGSGITSIWIDYNQNGIYAASEWVQPFTSGTTGSSTIIVPAGAINGLTGMRVRSRAAGNANGSGDGCTGFGSGTTEDFSVTITGGTPSPSLLSFLWTVGSGSGLLATNNTQSVNGTNITALTTYNVAVSNALCTSHGSVSVDVGGTLTASATATIPSGAYGASSATNTADEEILNVTFGTLNQTSTCATTGTGAGSVLNMYSNYTSGVGAPAAPSIAVGTPTSFSVQVGTCGGTFTNRTSIFIDYNHNGSFADVGETVFAGLAASGPHFETGSITVPGSAISGNTRMRVVTNETSGTVAPTGTFTWGETEDYTITITGGASTTPCAGATFNLASNAAQGGAPYTYAWTSSPAGFTSTAANPSVVVSQTTGYTVVVTDACGVTATSTATATVIVVPVDVTASSSTACGNQTVTLTATGANTYTWSPAGTLNSSTGAVVIASLTDTVSYIVIGTLGACTGRDTITINWIDPPSLVITNSDPILCGAGTVNSELNASSANSNYVYTWSPVDSLVSYTGGPDAITNVSATTTFTVTAVDNVSGCIATATTAVSIYTFSEVNLTSSNDSICPGSSSTLNTGVSATAFSVSSILSAPQVAPGSGITTLVTGGAAVVAQSSGSLDDGGWAGIPIGFNFNFFGTSYSSVNVGTNGVLQFGAYNSSQIAQYFFGSGIPSSSTPLNIIATMACDMYLPNGGSLRYWTTGTSPNRTFVVEYLNVPGYTANGLQNVQAIMHETTGVIDIQVTQATSTAAKTIGVQDATLPTPIGSTAPGRNAFTGSIGAEGWRFQPPINYTFAWTPNNGTLNNTTVSNPVATPTVTTTYTVLITNPVSNCQILDSLTIVVNPVPNVPVVSNVSICGPKSVVLTASGGGPVYRWYADSVTTTPVSVANPFTTPVLSQTTIYYVSSFDLCESARIADTVTFVNPPAFEVSSANYNGVCVGDSATLFVSAGLLDYDSFTWSPATGLSATTGSTVKAAPGSSITYTVNAASSIGLNCANFDTVHVTIHARPVVAVTAAPEVLCNGNTAQLQVIANGGSSGTLPTYCAVTNAGGSCITNVTFNTLNHSSAACENAPANYTSVPEGTATTVLRPGNTYTFNLTLNGTGIASVFIDYNHDGVYDASEWQQVFTNAASGAISITVPSNAVAGRTGMRVRSRLSGNANGPTDGCLNMGSGETEDFVVAISNPVLYSWAPNAELSSTTIANPVATPVGTGVHNYYVTVSDSVTGCSTVDTVSVTLNASPTPTITPGSATICQGQDFLQYATDLTGPYSGGYPVGTRVVWILDGTPAPDTLSSGTGVSTIGISTFQATVILPASLGGCSATSAIVTVTTYPFGITPVITPATCGNSNGKVKVTVSGTGPYNYTWSTGRNIIGTSSTMDSITGLTGGSYTLQIVDQNCNSGVLTFNVPSTSAPVASIQSQTNVTCYGAANGIATITETGGVGAITYTWSPLGGSNAASDPLPPGAYTVAVADSNGCADTVVVTITQPDSLIVTGIATTNATCGMPDGIAVASISGGTAPFTFAYYDLAITNVFGDGTATASNLPAGTYILYVTDSNQCTTPGDTFIVNENCSATLNLTAFIEGYYLGGSTMNSPLFNVGLTVDPLEIDTIRVELRDPMSPADTVATGVAIIHSNGTASFTFPASIVGGSYYIAVFNRGTIETWSLLPVTFTANTAYDFTTASAKAYDDGINLPMIQVGTVWAFYSGDIDKDGTVSGSDANFVDNDASVFAFGYNSSDLNGDGATDGQDANFIDNNGLLFLFTAHP